MRTPACWAHVKLRRSALWIWYRGDGFHGFQWQKDGRSVQQALEEGLRPLGITTRPMPAGRTDRGVSARMQVVMVKAAAPESEIAAAGSRSLGAAGGVVHVARANDDFQPQWSATGKEYRYRLWLRAGAPPPFCWAPGALPVEALRAAVAQLQRTADFSAFHAANAPRRERTVEEAEVVERADGVVEVRLRGDSFARHQVRLMVGTACRVAAGRISMDAFVAALTAQQRVDGIRAPAEALVLWSVRYPATVDPFSPELRQSANGLPCDAPFD